MLEEALYDLWESGCVDFDGPEVEATLAATPLGRIASRFYLFHRTMRVMMGQVDEEALVPDLLAAIAAAAEFDELPVRHTEDAQCRELAARLPLEPPTDKDGWLSPHLKAHLLMQAHLSRVQPLPSSDFYFDQSSTLAQAMRLVQAVIEVTQVLGVVPLVLNALQLGQMLSQGLWATDSPLLSLPDVEVQDLPDIKSSLRKLAGMAPDAAIAALKGAVGLPKAKNIAHKHLRALPDPVVSVRRAVVGGEEVLTVAVRPRRGKFPTHAFAPKMQRKSPLSAWVVVGEGNALVALELMRLGGRKAQEVEVPLVEGWGKLTVNIVFDGMVGFDETFEV